MVAVVGDLLHRLRGQWCERAVLRGEFGVEQLLVGGEVELAGDGVREVAVRLLDQLEVAEGAFLAQIGEFVLVAGQGQQHPGLAEQVQGDVGEGDLLLQDGGVPGPLPQAVGEHQGVVAQGERGGHRDGAGAGGGAGRGAGGGHRCFTPSGIS